MTHTRIKICGLKDPAMARAAAEAGADAIGLVFVHGSPRSIEPSRAKAIIDALPPFVEPVGLFVDATVEHVREVTRELGLHMVQLHGHETPHYAAALAPVRVIKSISFDDDAAQVLEAWRDACPNLAAILFDAPPAHTNALPGGSGHTFDWDALAKLQHSDAFADMPPLMLSGGLNPGNVAQAIKRIKPYAVDVSSGVESTRGVKDARLIAAFCEAVRRVEG